jgi:hypothetical protein
MFLHEHKYIYIHVSAASLHQSFVLIIFFSCNMTWSHITICCHFWIFELINDSPIPFVTNMCVFKLCLVVWNLVYKTAAILFFECILCLCAQLHSICTLYSVCIMTLQCVISVCVYAQLHTICILFSAREGVYLMYNYVYMYIYIYVYI